MTLKELLQEVKEENLTKTQLESYYTSLSNMAADLSMEIANHKKDKALFEASDPNSSVAKMKVLWKASEKGQRLLQLEGYMRAVTTQLRSLKNRLYVIY